MILVTYRWLPTGALNLDTDTQHTDAKSVKANRVTELNCISPGISSRDFDTTAQNVLGVNRSCFHLSSFSGVTVTLPCIPVHTFPGNRVFAVVIKTV